MGVPLSVSAMLCPTNTPRKVSVSDVELLAEFPEMSEIELRWIKKQFESIDKVRITQVFVPALTKTSYPRIKMDV